ncbi:EscU/YscU/HrcU family type III secretion system export apparatus switch protein [Paracoccaceae bacterium]|nr:EscU/YscU/HrcU family type III secretion system export apparatus switch protein [Paracoccaceae bacterium]
MAEEDAQEKTEEPTAKRLEKASEDGTVLQSKDLMVFTTLFVGLLVYYGLLNVSNLMLGQWGAFFRFDLKEFKGEAVRLSFEAVKYVVVWGMIIGIPLVIGILMTQASLSGTINFAPKAMAFKGNRINPVNGLKRMFGPKALFELAKSVIKVVFLIGAAAAIIFVQLPILMTASHADLTNGLGRVHDVFIALFVTLLLVLAFIALLDVMYQRYTHVKQLKMSKQEVKDENKQTEGSPEVKGKIRRMQMESSQRASQQRQALGDVPSATAIITNPTHFAVALKYEVGERGAPVILAMGRGKMAADIIEIANNETVPIFQSPLLARALFFTGNIGQEIHEELFSAVAAVLAFIFRIANGEELEAPDVEIPDDLKFTETGGPFNA